MAETRLGGLFRRAACAAATLLAAPCALAFPIVINPNVTSVSEYYNGLTGHYFLAADTGDINAVESGAAGPDWRNTTAQFWAYVPAPAESDTVPVSRFYAPGPNSHFYTADPAELAAVRAPGSGWIDEGEKFRVFAPVGGACSSPYGHTPIHRLYNNRFIYNDSAHRWVIDDEVRADMVSQGWIDEGVVFCTGGGIQANARDNYFAGASPVLPVADCLNEPIGVAGCLGLNNLPVSYPNVIRYWSAPQTSTAISPDWSDEYSDLTGVKVNVWTAQPIDDRAAVLAHTFLQGFLHDPSYAPANDTSIWGVHVSSLDATGPLASVDSMCNFPTTDPARRVFPWRFEKENYIQMSHQPTVKTVRRSDPQSHAYGNALVEFKDIVSGQSVDVTLLAYGTVPPGDFVSINDPATGNVWVSTTLGDSMLFGKNLGSAFVPCSGAGPCEGDPSRTFKFRITKMDFASILSRARVLNPVLSPDPGNYMLARFLWRDGILGNADLGVYFGGGLDLATYGY